MSFAPAIKIDVVLLSWRQKAYLRQAVDSILAQSFRNFRLIAVEDGSRDGSLEILKNYQAMYPDKIIVCTHAGYQNRGILQSLKLGLSKASAPLVAFLDADDLWGARNLEKKIEVFDRFPQVVVAFSSYRPFGEVPASLYWRFHRRIHHWTIPKRRPFCNGRQLLHRNNVASFSNFAVRRWALEKIPLPFGVRDRLDWWILSHLSLQARFYYIPEALCHWRIRRGSASYGKWNRKKTWRLQLFFWKLYRSLSASLSGSDGTLADIRYGSALLSAIRDQESVRRSRNWLYPARVLRHPITCIRFLTHVLLKNLMVHE